ncbi:MAG: magnesium-translocating P-type ATPase [Methanospirillum sp.]
MAGVPEAYWSLTPEDVLADLGSSAAGLGEAEAAERGRASRHLRLGRARRASPLLLLLNQFRSPTTLLLLGATLLSLALGDLPDAAIILVIVGVSGLLGFYQEYRASGAIAALTARVRTTAPVLRSGREIEVDLDEVVPGDLLRLEAGRTIAGDARIVEATDLYVDESALTGETFPVEKAAAPVPADAPLAGRTSALYLGTHVVSGTATAVVVAVGRETEFGRISERLRTAPPETDFERGIRHFGYLLVRLTALLIFVIFAINVSLARPFVDSLLFALALAVGLTPQLLPAIISVNLATGARRMAAKQVIVRQLTSIENFGAMTLLCADKTGTMTEGVVRVQSANDLEGSPSDRVLRLVYLNSAFETGFTNPIDEAVRALRPIDLAAYTKRDEVPYDFVRKRLSIVVESADGWLMITKGALNRVLDICTTAERPDGTRVPIEDARQRILDRLGAFSGQGYRVLGIAYRPVPPGTDIQAVDEKSMIFVGFLVLHDPVKPDAAATVAELAHLGIRLCLVTGDNPLVAAHAARQVLGREPDVVTGGDLQVMNDEALRARAPTVDVFAAVEPNQKERIILALKRSGAVVGYIGDGINDAPALHAADVGISVESAVDVAKEAAQIVLLEKDLGVLVEGVREGRVTFANTLKYIFMATSANFGNMFSMAGAALFLPFLPLLPKQILLTNLLTDLPETTIATDTVDPELVDRPRSWDLGFIKRFMLVFGLLSSVFDFITFGVLLFLLHATPEQFRTGWFLESVVSAALIVLVVRSRRPFYRSRPGRQLRLATGAIVVVAIALPYTPLAPFLGLVPLPLFVLAAMGAVVLLYIGSAEMVKRTFYRSAVRINRWQARLRRRPS